MREIPGLRIESESFLTVVTALDVFETIGNQSLTVFAIPVEPQKATAIRLDYFVFDVGFNFGATGTMRAMLLRDAGAPTFVGKDNSALQNFVAPFPLPSIDLNPNAPNRSIDVVLVGKADLTLHWHVGLHITRSV